MSKIKVNEIEAATGSTVTIPTGQTFTVTDGIPATNLSGTIADARLPTVPVSKGGTGVTSLGTANQVLAVNSGASALEFQDASSGIIKQVVVNNMGPNKFTNTSNNDVDVTTSVTSITPSSTSSKILFIGSFPAIRKEGSTYGEFDIMRQIGGGGYSEFDEIVHGFLYTNSSITQTGHLGAMRMDNTHNTTSQIDYKIRFRSVANTGTISFNTDTREMSTITLMEIE